MLKTLLFCTLIISAFSSYNFDLDDIVNIQEGDIQLLYDLYLQYLAPSEITLSAERYSNFKADVLDIVAHNNDPTNTWKMGVTQFTGMTMDELRGTAVQDQKDCFLTNGVTAKGLKDLPASKDWRQVGAISSVKNQGKCGSCWTFAATGAMEAHHAIQHGSKPLSLSQQQLVDCARGFDTFGCNGGLPSRAYEYVRHAGGIQTEQDYPYTGKDETCKFDNTKVAVTVPYGSYNITSFDEQAILETVATIGPVSISYESTPEFKNYHGGVFVGKTCRNGKSTLNHDVLIVGYGTDPESKLDYWIIKNSWGTKFGEAGYFRMQRGVNMCGIATCASYPSLKARN